MNEGIETRLVYGFLDAGKTTYIRDCIQNDVFHKYGTTLILCFEQGVEEYDAEALAARRTSVAYYEGEEDVRAFCTRCIERFRPDRVYVEMNAMMQDLREQLPDGLRIASSVMRIDWSTLPLYFRNFRQMMQRMAAASQQITFRGCPSKELLAPYSQPFRLMNRTASYLRQDPMGYHERAFDRFVPFSLDAEEITISEESYLPFWLDAFDHPEHYEGKTLRFSDPLELRRAGADGPWSAGRVVMVCCMADLQFMAIELADGGEPLSGVWIALDALAIVESDAYGQKRLKLRPRRMRSVPPPTGLILQGDRASTRSGEE